MFFISYIAQKNFIAKLIISDHLQKRSGRVFWPHKNCEQTDRLQLLQNPYQGRFSASKKILQVVKNGQRAGALWWVEGIDPGSVIGTLPQKDSK